MKPAEWPTASSDRASGSQGRILRRWVRTRRFAGFPVTLETCDRNWAGSPGSPRSVWSPQRDPAAIAVCRTAGRIRADAEPVACGTAAGWALDPDCRKITAARTAAIPGTLGGRAIRTNQVLPARMVPSPFPLGRRTAHRSLHSRQRSLRVVWELNPVKRPHWRTGMNRAWRCARENAVERSGPRGCGDSLPLSMLRNDAVRCA